MSILKEFYKHGLQHKRADEFAPGVTIAMASHQINENEIGSMSYQFGFYLEAKLRVTFYANKAQHEGALRNAEKQILHHLYKDIREPLLRAKSCVFAGDAKGTLDALDAIATEISQ